MTDASGSRWDIQKLDGSHDRAPFDCGKPALNDWLQRLASLYERRDLARVYAAVESNRQRVVGYYAVSAHQVVYEALLDEQAKGLPLIDVPVILLGRLAVDKTVQRRGLGEHLLLDALRRADHISRHVGVRAVEVHALDQSARAFYLKYGFVTLRDDQHHLYLPMHVIRKLHLPPIEQ